jgi:hypothetical protein
LENGSEGGFFGIKFRKVQSNGTGLGISGLGISVKEP